MLSVFLGHELHFNLEAFNDEVTGLRSARDPALRAVGDNFAFEENVGPKRLVDFEEFDAMGGGLKKIAAEYYHSSVQGEERNHTPSTFRLVNASALMSVNIERAQKIVRVEHVDDALQKAQMNFDDLRDAVASNPPDDSVVAPFLRVLNEYSGARPAFACFKAEVAADLAELDWLSRLRVRLGLGHHALSDGQTAHFALMEYTVGEVFEQATDAIERPFAIPTVLESRNSEFFFPAPSGSGEGYAVDLDTLPIRLTPMTATCRVPPLSRVKLGIGWSRGVARDAEQ